MCNGIYWGQTIVQQMLDPSLVLYYTVIDWYQSIKLIACQSYISTIL